jgi:VWFA-related protein
MKTVSVFLIISFFISPAVLFSQQEKIVEKVTVDWWVIPVFAVDQAGKSVTDLKAADIELKVDNKKIATFELIRRSFTVSVSERSEIKEPSPPPPPEKRIRHVFLLFDTALSTKESTDKAKVIARKIVTNAEKNTRFFIMVIEPFSGLVYVGGQTNDKAALTDIIDKKVKGRKNARVPSASEVIASDEGKISKYDPEDLRFLRARAGKYYKRKSKSFTQSFESLYYALSTIKENKFVYLFTEGISNAVQDTETGDLSLYRRYLTRMAEYLGRSGAVLFIINTFGTTDPGMYGASGENYLRFLSRKSGGKYLEGKDEMIIEKIENLHQAYYEIFFPAAPKTKTGTVKISIQPKRKGIDIHTLQFAEKPKHYAQMQSIQQEVLALNLITGNPLYESGLSTENVKIDNVSKKRRKVIYQVAVPDRMVNQRLDLYKLWISKTGPEGKHAESRIEKETIPAVPRKMKITFKKVSPGDETYFVLIDARQKSALVHGIGPGESQVFRLSLPREPRETTGWASKEVMEKERREEKPGERQELELLLTGAADYCEKLKEAAFHYICKEKILETQKPLTTSSSLQRDTAVNPNPIEYMKPTGWVSRQQVKTAVIKNNVFNYRLIKLGKQVKEERDLVDEKEKGKEGKHDKITTQQALKGIRFISGKAVFGPITLLAAERQGKYHFRLLGYKELKGRRTAIIEAFPKNEKDSQYVYGKLWIDTADFSVLKIGVNPNSVVGYDGLRKLADELNTRLLLTLETEFFKFRDGLRFPTRILFDEMYKGGPFITSRRGSRGWNRTKTVTTYTNYMFFSVETDVIYK